MTLPRLNPLPPLPPPRWRHLDLLAVAFACGVLAGCDAGSWEQPPIPRTAVVCGIDESGSVRAELRAAVREVCVGELQRLEVGWVEVRRIGRVSLPNEQLLVRVERAPHDCPNPFAARCRASSAQEATTFARELDAAITKVREPPARTATGTDLMGFLVAASEALSEDSAAAKTIVLATDLEETMHRPADLRVPGAVEVWLQLPEAPAVAERLRTRFRDAMLAASAASVRFHPLPIQPDSTIPKD